jgi:hypothetical protein
MAAHLARFESEIASQHGLITRLQLRDGGLNDDQVRELLRQKVLRRLRPGVLGLVGARDSWERGLLAVVLARPGSVASHASAARLWNCEPRPADRYEVTGRGEYRERLRGVGHHRSRTLSDDDVVQRADIPCTSFERTLCDCSTLLSEYQLGRVLDDGLRRGVASLRRLRNCAERLESGPGRRMSVVRSLLTARVADFHPGGSKSELNVLDVLRRARLPLPVQQLRVTVGSKTYRPDFAWPAAKVFAEYYGLPFHIGASAVAADSERLTALSAAGWLPLVFTNASSDREIVERTAAALHQRGLEIEISA